MNKNIIGSSLNQDSLGLSLLCKALLRWSLVRVSSVWSSLLWASSLLLPFLLHQCKNLGTRSSTRFLHSLAFLGTKNERTLSLINSTDILNSDTHPIFLTLIFIFATYFHPSMMILVCSPNITISQKFV